MVEAHLTYIVYWGGVMSHNKLQGQRGSMTLSWEAVVLGVVAAVGVPSADEY